MTEENMNLLARKRKKSDEGKFQDAEEKAHTY
jgi:hypothetical protein